MAYLLLEQGALRITVKYVQKRKLSFYFRRRIPDDVSHLYPGKNGVIVQSLKTKDSARACKEADRIAREQDTLWDSVRSGEVAHTSSIVASANALLAAFDVRPGSAAEYAKIGTEPDALFEHLRGGYANDPNDDAVRGVADLPLLESVALDLYHGKKFAPSFSEVAKLKDEIKGRPTDEKAQKQRQNAYDEFIALCGDLPINAYKRDHARGFVRKLGERGLYQRSLIKTHMSSRAVRLMRSAKADP